MKQTEDGDFAKETDGLVFDKPLALDLELENLAVMTLRQKANATRRGYQWIMNIERVDGLQQGFHRLAGILLQLVPEVVIDLDDRASAH